MQAVKEQTVKEQTDQIIADIRLRLDPVVFKKRLPIKHRWTFNGQPLIQHNLFSTVCQ